jgi:hypothetical protein
MSLQDDLGFHQTGRVRWPMPTRVRALDDRIESIIHFPRLLGYRYQLPEARLSACFTEASHLVLSSANIPTETELQAIIGESTFHTLDALKSARRWHIQDRQIWVGSTRAGKPHHP